MNLKDSQTYENLMKSFAGESQARNRYNISASIAKDEGHFVIESIFNYTADQERMHAKMFYKQLKDFAGNVIHIEGTFPIDLYDSTAKVLRAAEHNELEEWDVVYKNFGIIAREEGFNAIANLYDNIAKIEKTHAERFGRMAEELENGILYRRDDEIAWICTKCGHIHVGKIAPKMCPVCMHPQGYFMSFSESFAE